MILRRKGVGKEKKSNFEEYFEIWIKMGFNDSSHPLSTDSPGLEVGVFIHC